MKEIFAEILLPVPHSTWTFSIPAAVAGRAVKGMSVAVRIGKGKIHRGVICSIGGAAPEYEVKPIISLLEEYPPIAEHVIDYWFWIADYYMCEPGDVMRASAPAVMKPTGADPNEFFASVYSPRALKMISLHDSIIDEDILNTIFDKLRRAPRQYEALLRFAEVCGEKDIFSQQIERASLGLDPGVLRTLINKNILREESVQQDRVFTTGTIKKLPLLSDIQQNTVKNICEIFRSKKPALLHGITGSGKTEVYMNLAANEMNNGRNVMILVPEIALTTQLIYRYRTVFPDALVYHSGMSEKQKADNYYRIVRSGGGQLVIGVRSLVLLPVCNPGLIIIDEEHDPSYKQTESLPRYNARDCAIMLGRMSGANVLMGSATPSVESYYNSMQGKYGLAVITQRYGNSGLPDVLISDTVRSVKRGERKGHLNKILSDNIRNVVKDNGQVILFQNRRGYSPYVQCEGCGWIAGCPNCNVSLKYHRKPGELKCHYCGHTLVKPEVCPQCSSTDIKPMGFGTEKVEDELRIIFPGTSIARIDRDTATSPSRLRSIISSFEQGKIDILIGTQMVTKGFDFQGVRLVGVLNADNLFSFPDFRSSERAFQTLYQTSGRAGRRQEKGTVVIQTSQPDNKSVLFAASQDYHAMYNAEIEEREAYLYPPFCRIISIELKSADREILHKSAAHTAKRLQEQFGKRVLGPQAPAIDKIRNQHILVFTLKLENGIALSQAKQELKKILSQAAMEYKKVRITADVDPQ